MMEKALDQPNQKNQNAHSAILTVGFFLVFLLSGLHGIDVALKRSTLTCDRQESTQIECKLVSSGISGTESTRLFPLIAATLETQTDSTGGGETYRVMLTTPNQKKPLMEDFYSYNVVEKSQQISAFIGNLSQKSLVVRQSASWIILIPSSFFVLLGGIGIIVTLPNLTAVRSRH